MLYVCCYMPCKPHLLYQVAFRKARKGYWLFVLHISVWNTCLLSFFTRSKAGFNCAHKPLTSHLFICSIRSLISFGIGMPLIGLFWLLLSSSEFYRLLIFRADLSRIRASIGIFNQCLYILWHFLIFLCSINNCPVGSHKI